MYYYVLIFLSFISFSLQNLPVKKRRLYILANSYIFFILIFFVSCFRFGVGTDFFSYSDIFKYNYSTEPLFYGLIQGIKYLGGNYQFFVAFIFIISFGLKLYVFQKLSYEKGLFLCIMLFCSFYYIAYDINAIRQGLALSLTLLACYYAYKRNKYRYYATCLVAILIHYTAFVFLPFYMLLNLNISKKNTIIIVLLSVFLSRLGIFHLLIDLVTNLLGNSLIALRIQNYSNSENFDNNLLFTFSTIRRILFFLLILFTYEKISAPDRMKKIIFCGGFISIIIYLLFSEVGYFSVRLSAYYRIIECFWLSYFPFVFKNRNTRIIIAIFFIFYSLLQVSSALSTANNNLLPIQTIFF